ncbi:MAG: AAA family ATPase, partial [Bdellovibrionales bacterium]|nr:AAA family ATPase [Bdellovibrionales bacterium]
MIVWINGPFGSGKTTLAEELSKKISRSLIFDPEIIGSLIQRIPFWSSKDFQDIPLWRTLVVVTLSSLQRFYPGTILVPMTLIESNNIHGILNNLSKCDQNLIHVFLDLEESTLRQRITDQKLFPKEDDRDQQVRSWRLNQVDRGLAARAKMPANTIFLNSGNQSPEALSEAVLEAYKNHLAA